MERDDIDSVLFSDPQEEPKAEKPEVTQAEPEGQGEKQQDAEGEQPEAPVSAPPADAGHKSDAIPISALLDERERRQKAEREAQELRKWREEVERKQAQKPAPDPFEDPQGAYQHQARQFEQMLMNERLNMSEALARQTAGDDAVNAALEAYQTAVAADPTLSQRVLGARNPYGELLSWHKRHTALKEIGDDPASYRERLKAELLAELQAQNAAPMAPSRPPTQSPPPSLARAPSSGKATEAGTRIEDVLGIR